MGATSRPAGQRTRWRDVDGILLLDKPAGLSSNDALQRVRRLLQAAKAGHAGTLDPMATGMLPLCFGQGTKACGQLLGSTKAYRATIGFGARTDTGDAEGQVVERGDLPQVDRSAVETVLAQLCGNRAQVPPMYSALKREGRPLYELARAGQEVERSPRPIRIERLECLSLTAQALEFEVTCSKGTYVRVLGEEIAARLGSPGHLTQLRRLWVAPFDEEPLVSLGAVEAWAEQGGWEQGGPSGLLPVDRAFAGLPRLDLDPTESLHLRQGRALSAGRAGEPGEQLRVYGADGGFLGLVARGEDGNLRVQRLFVAGAGADGAAKS